MTKYAKEILHIIHASKEHLTAEQIFLQMKKKSPKVVLATIYNNLHLLYENDMIRKVSVEGQPDRYDRNTKHDHLVCKKCGRLSDVVLDDLTNHLQSQMDEQIISYDLQIHYICPYCRKKEV